MRHKVPDAAQQQEQQQNFLASIQQQTTMVKDFQHKTLLPSTSMIKQEELGLLEQSSMLTKGSSINNCIISMNSQGNPRKPSSEELLMMKNNYFRSIPDQT